MMGERWRSRTTEGRCRSWHERHDRERECSVHVFARNIPRHTFYWARCHATSPQHIAHGYQRYAAGKSERRLFCVLHSMATYSLKYILPRSSLLSLI